jgi:uncharacterized protein
MKSIAIIGTGIAGMACGHYLHSRFDLTFYERNNYAGGHTNTVMVNEGGRQIPIDTGFMVYNETSHPELTRLFAAMEVETQPAAISLSVQHKPSGLEFSRSGLTGLFAQPQNLWNLSFWKLLKEIHRFNQEAPSLLEDPGWKDMTLQDYARRKGYSHDFLDRYLIPMSSVLWSTPAEAIREVPAVTLVRFLKNHGFLHFNTPVGWRTVTGGSRRYRDKITHAYRHRLRLNRAAVRITRRPGAIQVVDATGDSQSFDRVILACHADDALLLLQDSTPAEQALLAPFRYQKNIATLHTDESVMPETRRAWSSWNYRAELDGLGVPAASILYWMNPLQRLSTHKNYFVSINDPGRISPDLIIQKIDYWHPLYTLATIHAQKQLPSLNNNDKTFFCGSYFGDGLHEDALVSAQAVCARLGVSIHPV